MIVCATEIDNADVDAIELWTFVFISLYLVRVYVIHRIYECGVAGNRAGVNSAELFYYVVNR